jgi:hypothetical protein
MRARDGAATCLSWFRLVVICACAVAGCEHPSAGGSSRDCHHDCFGHAECRGGTVTVWAHSAVPCAAWQGACPIDNTFTCAHGCAAEPTRVNYRIQSPATLCEEPPSKVIGDPCSRASPTACLPTHAAETPDGGLQTTYLDCDPASSTCVAIEGPPLGELGVPCPPVPSTTVPPPASQTGYSSSSQCAQLHCLQFEDQMAGCVRTGCTRQCLGDHDCPSGWFCDKWLAHVNSGVPLTPVCRPAPRDGVPQILTCWPAR